MSHKLKGNDLKYAAEHIVVCRQHKRKSCRALIETDDEQSWGRLQTKLKDLYGANSVKDNSGDDLDFSLVFDDSGARDKAVNDINDAIEEYIALHPDTDNNFNYTPPQTTTSGEPEIDTSTSKDWTTYLVIGAAAVAIILLLWNRQKK